MQDSWSSFVPFDLPTDDLQQPGDGPAADAVTCQGMKEQRRGAAGCKHSAQVGGWKGGLGEFGGLDFAFCFWLTFEVFFFLDSLSFLKDRHVLESPAKGFCAP